MLYTTSVDELPSQIIIIIVLLLVNAFFAASEMAIISASPVKLDILIENGNKKAKLVKKLQENETKLLSTIQVGITLAGFFSSATAASSLSEIIAQSIGIPEGVSLVIITLILSYFTLVFGELFPKRIALLAPEKVAMTFAKPISVIKTIFRPIVFILWGRNAISKTKFLNNPKHLVLTSVHPSPLSAYGGFFGSKPFSKTNTFLINNNVTPIEWVKK
jgi:putative hemolysin